MSAPVQDPFAGPAYDTKTPLEERLKLRLNELKENREKFIAEAQRNLAAMDAAIAEMEALLDPDAARARAAQQNGMSNEPVPTAVSPDPALG